MLDCLTTYKAPERESYGLEFREIEGECCKTKNREVYSEMQFGFKNYYYYHADFCDVTSNRMGFYSKIKTALISSNSLLRLTHA